MRQKAGHRDREASETADQNGRPAGLSVGAVELANERHVKHTSASHEAEIAEVYVESERRYEKQFRHFEEVDEKDQRDDEKVENQFAVEIQTVRTPELICRISRCLALLCRPDLLLVLYSRMSLMPDAERERLALIWRSMALDGAQWSSIDGS